MGEQPAVRRVFLALWPDEQTREMLDRLGRGLDGPGRPVPREHLHLTLAFAGTIPAGQADCLSDRIEALACPPLDLTLDHLGHFARPRITWIGPSEPPAALLALADRAQALCRECGIDTGPPRPFRPHVSLRRHAAPPVHERIETPLHWAADTIVLIESGRDGHPGSYRILART
ncbi:MULTISPECIES: RNA 2',3'-cyclic phosphodiesterase [unclassified Thioalkalivibrio]|uniref:RNA 2',3'-cyclic phosphodiesterase n=1 Tax=unclassified Thioalkalivibrio TaxID=2621013 RepID=UPI000378A7B0|nr:MULTISPECIES: RNA 2',3'-cyclic phosphodiesterase [unclassified Thioalkalivibrio]